MSIVSNVISKPNLPKTEIELILPPEVTKVISGSVTFQRQKYNNFYPTAIYSKNIIKMFLKVQSC